MGRTFGGLYRHDGYKIKTYTAVPDSISTNYAPVVFVNSEGLIWIGTVRVGLNVYNKETDTFSIYKNDPDDQNSINSDSFNWEPSMIVEDKEGIIWSGTKKALNKF